MDTLARVTGWGSRAVVKATLQQLRLESEIPRANGDAAAPRDLDRYLRATEEARRRAGAEAGRRKARLGEASYELGGADADADDADADARLGYDEDGAEAFAFDDDDEGPGGGGGGGRGDAPAAASAAHKRPASARPPPQQPQPVHVQAAATSPEAADEARAAAELSRAISLAEAGTGAVDKRRRLA